MKIPKALAAAVVSAILFSGCTDLSFGEQTLLRPPRATGDKAEIQNIIKEQASGNYTLKYPQKGQYRSAVTLFETGGKNKEYAVALYSTESDSQMNISVIAHEADGWVSLGSFKNSGTGVDRVILNDINNDGEEEILVGWSNYNSGMNSLSAYSFEDESVREMKIDETYTDMIISDITGNKLNDIILLSLRNNQSPSGAKLLQYSEQEKKPIGKFALQLDSEVTSFVNVACGQIEKNSKGIIIDGEKSGGLLTTQVLYYDAETQTIANPLLTENDAGVSSNVTTRKDVITCRDIDNDGIIDIPVVSQMAAPTDTAADRVCSMISWRQIDTSDGSLHTKFNTVMNYTDGYYFIMPEKWNGNVTAISDAENRRIDFYIWDKVNSSLGIKLLTICRFNSNEWNNINRDNYLLLKNSSNKGKDYIIAAQNYPSGTEKNLYLSRQEIEKAVKLIS